MAEEKLNVLTKEGVQKLAEQILSNVNNRIDERIVGTITEDSDVKHTPSAAAVYEAMKSINHIVPLVIASGDPAAASIEPDGKTLYVVRKTAEDTNATSYIYAEGAGFIKVGSGAPESMGPDLSGITDDDISAAVNAAASATKPTL